MENAAENPLDNSSTSPLGNTLDKVDDPLVNTAEMRESVGQNPVDRILWTKSFDKTQWTILWTILLKCGNPLENATGNPSENDTENPR